MPRRQLSRRERSSIAYTGSASLEALVLLGLFTQTYEHFPGQHFSLRILKFFVTQTIIIHINTIYCLCCPGCKKKHIVHDT